MDKQSILQKYVDLQLSPRQTEQVVSMVGKKVDISFGTWAKGTKRILKQNSDGIYYIDYRGRKVPCRPDTSSLNVMCFLAMHPDMMDRYRISIRG